MEKAQTLAKEARQRLKVADHILTQTYPLIKDPKLLLAVFDNLYKSVTDAVSALLYHERAYKRILPFHDSFESRLDVFKLKVAERYGFGEPVLTLIHELRDFKNNHKKCSLEFTRKDKLVVCSDGYDMDTLSSDKLSKHINQATSLIKKIDEIMQK